MTETGERVASRSLRRTRRWASQESGPTATAAQRARRRQRLGGAPRAIVCSRRPPTGVFAAALADAGLQVDWTDNGPGAVAEAAGGDLALCVLDIGRLNEEGLDFLPCLNQIDPWLPVIVVNDRDSLETQRKLRNCRVFFYLVGSVDREGARFIVDAAVKQRLG